MKNNDKNNMELELEMFSFLAQHLLTLKANIVKPSKLEGIPPETVDLDFFFSVAVTSMAYIRLKVCNNTSDEKVEAVITKITNDSADVCRLVQAHNRKHNAH